MASNPPQGRTGGGSGGGTGPTGPAGPAGQDGAAGAQGIAGEGVPTGGNAGQILSKETNADFATHWINAIISGGGGNTSTAAYGVVASNNVGKSHNTPIEWESNFRGTANITFNQARDQFTLPAGNYILYAYLTQHNNEDTRYQFFTGGVVSSGSHTGSSRHSDSVFPDVVIASVSITNSAIYELRPSTGAHNSDTDIVLVIQSLTGERGADGQMGARGADGQTGQTGSDGQPGAAGQDGATGQTGPAGNQGATGQTGPAGAPGSQGPQGIQGVAGQDLGTVTLNGDGGESIIYAEEGNASLSSTGGESNDGFQWSFGNGEDITNNALLLPHDIVIASLALNKSGTQNSADSATVEIYVDDAERGSVSVIGGQTGNVQVLDPPVIAVAGSRIRFRTTAAVWADGKGAVVSASVRTNGVTGPAGQDGDDGAAGQGVPTGGNDNQILAKASDNNFDTEWINAPSGGDGTNGVGIPTGGLHRQVLAKAGNADFDTEWTDPRITNNSIFSVDGDLEGTEQNVQNAEHLIDDNDDTIATFNATNTLTARARINLRTPFQGTGHRVVVPLVGYNSSTTPGSFNLTVDLLTDGTVTRTIRNAIYNHNVPFDVPSISYDTVADDEFDQIEVIVSPQSGTDPHSIGLRVRGITAETTFGAVIGQINRPMNSFIVFDRRFDSFIPNNDHPLVPLSDESELGNITIQNTTELVLPAGKYYQLEYEVGGIQAGNVTSSIVSHPDGGNRRPIRAWETGSVSRHSVDPVSNADDSVGANHARKAQLYSNIDLTNTSINQIVQVILRSTGSTTSNYVRPTTLKITEYN